MNNNIDKNKINETRTGIYLISTSNTISGNTIVDNRYKGIYIGSSLNTIKKNIIRENGLGIKISFGFKNKIQSNNIIENNAGINLTGSLMNIIKKNNIYNNEKYDADFMNSLLNRWQGNYWKDIYPIHFIKGVIYIERGWHWGSPPPLIIQMYNIDILNKLIPYDISKDYL
jgi:parallel beta-helix repeat protein